MRAEDREQLQHMLDRGENLLCSPLCGRKKRGPEALAYNGLVQSWPEIFRLAQATLAQREVQGEHKTYPSAAGAPHPRKDATKCDPVLHGDFVRLTRWLRGAVRNGHVGSPWEGAFPRYAWSSHGGSWYEARLVNREQGAYKGYEIQPDQLPEQLRPRA